jgi:hypothetical protein
MRQMIAVASMDYHALNAFPVKFAVGGAGAMILAQCLDFFEKLVLQFGCFLPFPNLE